MTLNTGARVGPFEILSPLGAGGMGEVYRARDSKLGRDVALKVLPAALAGSSERLARLQREARLLASLNHPHIAAIYGLEESDGGCALVMELVEGLTLQARLAQGALPVSEALAVAKQIAEALEYAHEHGIVHRDLKPGNVKLTPEGSVKVLDFGLAKALSDKPLSPDASSSPTVTSDLTGAGIILGTAAYMSPEQAQGKAVDRRTDIWSFGCVLYEMLTGRRAFHGETISDTLAALLKTEPDWDALPTDLAPRLSDLLERCLRKDPGRRLRDIGDARLEIEAAIAAGPSAATGKSGPGLSGARGVSLRQKIGWGTLGAALAALVAVALALSGSWPRSRPQQTRPLRVSIVHTQGNEVGVPEISPDGRRVAYRARRADGIPLLWVRDLDRFEARPLAGTEDGYYPFWSPDSRHLGFFNSGGFLRRIPADGGPIQVVTPVGGASGGTWAPDGTIVFSPWFRQLYRVSAAGGTAVPATTLPGADWTHSRPSFLPDGRRFLFTAKQWTRSGEASAQGIYIGSLDSPEVRRLLPDLSHAVYAPPGYIVFAREGILTAAPFDLDTGRLTGEPKSLGEAVAYDSTHYFTGISVAGDGTLAVRPPPACAPVYDPLCDVSLRLVDRGGRMVGSSAPEPYRYSMALAPDGRRVAARISDSRTGTHDLFLVDMQTGTRTPLTASHGFAGEPVWSPDGTRLAYAYGAPGQLNDVYVKNLRTGQVTPIIQSPAVGEAPVAWSHDGAHLLVWVGRDPLAEELNVWSFTSKSMTPFLKASRIGGAVFSPDDRYVAFTSPESGRHEVYVTTFPERRQTWPLTTEGGRVLSWRADGREILVATLSGHITAHPVSTEGGFTVGQPAILIRDIGSHAPYSRATPDHSRILIRVNPEAEKDRGEIRLLFGWAEALRKE